MRVLVDFFSTCRVFLDSYRSLFILLCLSFSSIGVVSFFYFGNLSAGISCIIASVTLILFARTWERRLLGAIVVVVFSFYSYSQFSYSDKHYSSVIKHYSESAVIQAKVVDFHCISEGNSYLGEKKRVLLEVQKLRFFEKQKWIDVEGKILAISSNSLRVQYGDIVELTGNFSRVNNSPTSSFDYSLFLLQNNIHSLYFIKNFVKISTGKGIVSTLLSIRDSYLGHITKGFEKTYYKQFMASVLFAFKQTLEPSIKESFLYSGMLHILAISGLHISLIAVFFFFLLRLCRVSYRWGFLALFLILFGYLFLLGFPISATRAFIMISLWCFGNFLFKNTNNINTLFVAGILIVIWQPLSLFSLGFQFSFLLVLMIMLFFKKFSNLPEIIFFRSFVLSARKSYYLRFFLRKIVFFLLISFVCFFVSIPLVIYYNQFFNPLSLFVNLFSSFLLWVLLLFSMINIFSFKFVIDIQEWAIDCLLSLSDFSHPTVMVLSKPPLLSIIIVYLSLLLLLCLRRSSRILFLFFLISFSTLFISRDTSNISIYAIKDSKVKFVLNKFPANLYIVSHVIGDKKYLWKYLQSQGITAVVVLDDVIAPNYIKVYKGSILSNFVLKEKENKKTFSFNYLGGYFSQQVNANKHRSYIKSSYDKEGLKFIQRNYSLYKNEIINLPLYYIPK